jgi:hypothetical protein
MEQMMDLLKAMQEMMEACIGSPASKMETKMDANQAKMDAKRAKMNATLQEVTEDMRAWQKEMKTD